MSAPVQTPDWTELDVNTELDAFRATLRAHVARIESMIARHVEADAARRAARNNH